jgi:hypothetical protein
VPMRLISRRHAAKGVPALACALAIPQLGVARAEQTLVGGKIVYDAGALFGQQGE